MIRGEKDDMKENPREVKHKSAWMTSLIKEIMYLGSTLKAA